MKDFLSFGEPLVGFYPSDGSSLIDSPRVVKTWGGDTSNFALGVAKLGRTVSYLTRVGDDPFGRGFLELWRATGVNTSLVEVDKTRKTGLYFVSFDGNKHSLTYYRADSAASAIGLAALDSLALESYRVVHLSGISLGMSPLARSFGLELVRRAKIAGARVSFDVNYRSAQWESSDAASACFTEALALGVDILEITDDEMKALAWGDRLSDVERRFPTVKTIVLKRGEAGAEVASNGQRFSHPSFPVLVVDTVGAGDSFDAGFLTQLVEGRPLAQAIRFAAATAAITCTGKGPLEKMPARREVERFLASVDSPP
jgi:2-dehydro-3-deoxygluconokinase